MDGLFSDEELFLTQNSFSEERVEDNFSIDSILDGLVACDEPVSQNSCKEELKQVVTEKSIKDGPTDPSNYPEAVRTKIEFSNAFDMSNVAVSLSGSIGSQKAPLKRCATLADCRLFN